MKTEDIIESLQLRCADGGFNDYLLVNALCRLRTLQSADRKMNELIQALEEIKKKIHGYTDKHICEIATNAIANAKGEK